MGNIFDESYKLYDEEISVRLSRKIFGDPVKCCLTAAKKKRQCPNFNSKDHTYSRKVAGSLDEVKEVCEMLCMSPVFLNSYHKTRLWSKYFNQSGYMKYHVENWYINVIRLEDMFLILINEAFQIGIKKELIGYEVMVTNENLPKLIQTNLKKFHKAIKPIRAARIMLMHHQTLYEKDLDEIRKDETLVKLLRDGGKNKDFENELIMIESFARRFKAPRYREDKRNFMLRSNTSLFQFVSEMLLLLEAVYITNNDRLTEKRLAPAK